MKQDRDLTNPEPLKKKSKEISPSNCTTPLLTGEEIQYAWGLDNPLFDRKWLRLLRINHVQPAFHIQILLETSDVVLLGVAAHFIRFP